MRFSRTPSKQHGLKFLGFPVTANANAAPGMLKGTPFDEVINPFARSRVPKSTRCICQPCCSGVWGSTSTRPAWALVLRAGPCYGPHLPPPPPPSPSPWDLILCRSNSQTVCAISGNEVQKKEFQKNPNNFGHLDGLGASKLQSKPTPILFVSHCPGIKAPMFEFDNRGKGMPRFRAHPCNSSSKATPAVPGKA